MFCGKRTKLLGNLVIPVHQCSGREEQEEEDEEAQEEEEDEASTVGETKEMD